MSEVEGLAKFGLFLSLAFILPGMIYVGFAVLYFPQVIEYFSWDLSSWVGFIGLSVFLGLTVTSICFVIEKAFYSFMELFGKFLEHPEIIKLGIFEARNKSTFYLNQVVGQYICHFNVGMGVLLITLLYAFLSIIDVLKLSFGIIISFANLYLSIGIFREWSVKAIKRYEEEITPKEKTAVVFDLDNTLVDTYEVYYHAKLNLAKNIKKFGGSIDIDKIDQIDRFFYGKFGTGGYNPRYLVTEACKTANCLKCDVDKLTECYNKEIKKIPKLLGSVKTALKTLREEGIYIVLLSEGIESYIEKTLKKNRIRALFNRVIPVTDEKSNVYNSVIQDLRNRGFKHIYCVGDSLQKDIVPGNSAGVYTIWIKSKWERDGAEEEMSVKPTYVAKNIKEILEIIK